MHVESTLNIVHRGFYKVKRRKVYLPKLILKLKIGQVSKALRHHFHAGCFLTDCQIDADRFMLTSGGDVSYFGLRIGVALG